MEDKSRLVTRHLVWGWGALGLFMVLGFAMELMHGFKVSWLLAVDNETRRFLWVLAHAHGGLLAILNLLFAFTLERQSAVSAPLRWASLGFLSAMILMPAGFLAGGLVIYQGDPGPGIVLALLGATILILSVATLTLALIRGRPAS